MSVDLQTNIVTIGPAADRVLELAAVPQAIRQSGYRPGTMRVRARGRTVADGSAFLIEGWPQPLPIAVPPHANAAEQAIEADVDVTARGPRLRLVRPATR